MTSQPEKLFREKLENFQRPAPAAAWDRIEAGLNQTNHKGWWMKIAAGLLVLSVAAFLLWPSTENNSDVITRTPDPVVPEHKTTPEETVTPVTPPVKENIATQKNTPKQPEEAIEIISEPQLASVEEQEALPGIETLHAEIIAIEPSSEKLASTTIVYTADEVNARFMKKEVIAEATPEEKKTSGIQKLMGLAYDLKNNDTAFGDLRQKKNEILALNFKEEKKEQNQ